MLLELGRAPVRVGEPEIGLAAARLPARRVRLALPARALSALARLGLDAARLAGGLSLVHQTRAQRGPPIVTAPECVALAELPPRGSPAEARLARRLARAALVVVFSAHAARLAMARLDLPPERIARVPVGCEHWLRALGAPPERARSPEIVVLGALHEGRGHLELLAALEALRAGGLDVRLWVIGRPGTGEGAFSAALERSSARAAVRRVADPEAFGDREVARTLAGASALVTLEPEPLTAVTPLEALSLGVPLVSARRPAFVEALGEEAEWVEGVEEGLAPARLAEALACAVRSAADEAARARRLAHAAPFTWEASARAHQEAWSALLGPAGAGSAALSGGSP